MHKQHEHSKLTPSAKDEHALNECLGVSEGPAPPSAAERLLTQVATRQIGCEDLEGGGGGGQAGGTPGCGSSGWL